MANVFDVLTRDHAEVPIAAGFGTLAVATLACFVIMITIVARVVATARLRAPLGQNPPGKRTSPTQPFPPTRWR